MSIWRINCKPGEQILSHQDQFDFWIKNEIIAISWSSQEGLDDGFIKNPSSKNLVNDVRNFMRDMHYSKGWKTKAFSTATNIFVDRMQIGDFIWIRFGNIYKLGKIVSECLYNFYSETFDGNRQIGYYRKVEFLDKDFKESDVPGKIVASYRTRSTVQMVYDHTNTIENYCQYYLEGREFKIDLKNWSHFLHSTDIEEIIGLYLQIEKNLFVYTSTNKIDTAQIEFELVDINGNHYGIQVKSGDTSIDAKDFENLSEQMKVYLFACNNNVYNLDKNRNIEKIEIDDVTVFLRKNLNLLPNRIKTWF
ncbi:MAG: hypothetical protein ACRCZH_06015 [Cetobacterium sp.]